MKRLLCGWLFLLLTAGGLCAPAGLTMPDFPAPPLATDLGGSPVETSMLHLLRDLHSGGVHGTDVLEAVDSDYALLASNSLARLSTWLEAACAGVGLDLARARAGKYDGAIYARLLGVATSIAASRQQKSLLAIPVGVLICQRTKPWGAIPGDSSRDAYVLFGTDRGFYVYDPPTRQVTPLAEFPNNRTVLRVRL